ncbi:MAG TPA: hypothetical protein VIL65_17975 [Beijerinckiaceae bacterium]|jgi:hypothetical protein
MRALVPLSLVTLVVLSPVGAFARHLDPIAPGPVAVVLARDPLPSSKAAPALPRSRDASGETCIDVRQRVLDAEGQPVSRLLTICDR